MEMSAPVAMMAGEEQLGDLKLYRVPEPVTVAAKGLKQVAFLQRDAVKGRMLYEGYCEPWDADDSVRPARMLFATVNDDRHGLGVALPMGGVTFFEPSAVGEQFVGEEQMRDHAEGQDVELALGESGQVFLKCLRLDSEEEQAGPVRKARMRAALSNANPFPVTVRLQLGRPSQWTIAGLRGTVVKNGQRVTEITVPANSTRDVDWQASETDADS